MQVIKITSASVSEKPAASIFGIERLILKMEAVDDVETSISVRLQGVTSHIVVLLRYLVLVLFNHLHSSTVRVQKMIRLSFSQ
jgi:hypothetical protein